MVLREVAGYLFDELAGSALDELGDGGRLPSLGHPGATGVQADESSISTNRSAAARDPSCTCPPKA